MKRLLIGTRWVYTLIIGILLVLAFVAGGIFMHSASASSAAADATTQKLAGSDCKPQQGTGGDTILGTIASIKGSTFTLKVFKGNGNGPTVTVTTTASTDVVSKLAGGKIRVTDLHIGDFVQVSGTKSHDGSFAGKSIVVGPAPSANDQGKGGKSGTNNQQGVGGFGRVTSISGSTFTIQDKGKTLTIKTTSQTEFFRKTTDTKVALSDLKVGDFVMVKGTLNSDGSINAFGVLSGAQADQQVSACKRK